MDKLILGRYIPGNSIVYKLDPRGKLLATFFFIGIIFLSNNWQTYLIALLFSIGAVAATKISPKIFWQGIRPMIWLILFTSALQVFFTAGGTTYFHWWIITISSFGLVNGMFIFLRFVMIILISTVLTLTTPPLSIADAMESLLKPLKVVRFPVTQIALVMSIALRFVPTLMDETTKIMNAQRARGVDFGAGNIFKQMKSIIPLLIPLFVNSLKIAFDLSQAMESRGYQGGEGRTKFRILQWHWIDLTTFGYFAVLTILLVIFRTH